MTADATLKINVVPELSGMDSLAAALIDFGQACVRLGTALSGLSDDGQPDAARWTPEQSFCPLSEPHVPHLFVADNASHHCHGRSQT